jgi:hypothetical protein
MTTITVHAVTLTTDHIAMRGKPKVKLVEDHPNLSVHTHDRPVGPNQEWTWLTTVENNLVFEFASQEVAFPPLRTLMWSDTFSEATIQSMIADQMQAIIRAVKQHNQGDIEDAQEASFRFESDGKWGSKAL